METEKIFSLRAGDVRPGPARGEHQAGHQGEAGAAEGGPDQAGAEVTPT